jgi:putative membrane protein
MSEVTSETGGSTRRRWLRIAVVGVLLPVAGALVLVWSALGRQDQIDKIPVAIVNNDTILTEPQPMAAGRALTASLTNPTGSDELLAWTLTDSDNAASGLRTGAYYAVLTIPSDFSKAIVSTGTNNPESGQITLESNAAANQTVPYISEQVVAMAADALGNQSTQTYLKNVYAGFNQIAQSNQTAADSAAQLASGTEQVAQGASELTSGADTLASSLRTLSSGASDLKKGTAQVSSGAAEAQKGSDAVAAGARALKDGAGRLAGRTDTLAGRAADYATKSRLASNAAARVAGGAATVNTKAQALRVALAGLNADCTGAGANANFCDRLMTQLNASRTLSAATLVHSKASQGVAIANKALADGAAALAAGDREVAGAARVLSAGSQRLSTNATQLAAGAKKLATGAAEVNSSTGKLVTGAQQAAAGAEKLATSSASLSSGASSANDGAQQLASGLAQGAAESPTYSKSQQNALAQVVSQPVELTHTSKFADRTNGWLLGGIVAVILWLAALAAALGRDVASARRFALSPVSSRRIALMQALPVVGLGLLQGAVIVIAVTVARVSVASSITLALLSLLAALTFSLIAYAMRLALGTTGVTLFVLFLLFQLSAIGNVLPIQTAPGLLQTLNSLLPLPAFINAASRLVTGGDVGSTLAAVLVLGVWSWGAYASTVTVVRRQRMLDGVPEQSHPPGRAVAV